MTFFLRLRGLCGGNTQKHTQALGGDVLFSFWPAQLGALLFNIAGSSPADSFKRKKRRLKMVRLLPIVWLRPKYTTCNLVKLCKTYYSYWVKLFALYFQWAHSFVDRTFTRHDTSIGSRKQQACSSPLAAI